MTCTVFPKPMSSARQAPNPKPVTSRSQLTPVCWYWRSSAHNLEDLCSLAILVRAAC